MEAAEDTRIPPTAPATPPQVAPPVQKPKQSDVARRAGVSASTVSKVVNGGPGISAEVRDRVLRAMKDVGYAADQARLPAAAAPRRVALITYYQFLTRDGAWFHADVLATILEECERRGLEIETILLNRDGAVDVDRLQASLETAAADAVLIVGIDAPEVLRPTRSRGLPGVIVNGVDPELGYDCVLPAAREGSRLATRHLIELGHRDIVHVTHLYRPFIRRRLEGFRDAFEEAGLPFDPERNVINIPQHGHFSIEMTADAIERRMRDRRLEATALFCASDYIAFGTIQGIQRAGYSVPDDVSVISFDDLPLSQLCRPAITSVGVDRVAIGRLAVERVVGRLQDLDGPTLRIDVGARLTIRDSTRAFAAAVAEPA
jgi:DNA-binding LacI/PurR family transcriptional regulator